MKINNLISFVRRVLPFILPGTFLLLVSCIPQKKLIMMQYDKLIDSTYAKTFTGKTFEDSVYRIQPNDYLYISITSVDKPITQFVEPVAGINYLNEENQALVGYHVDDYGNIHFPYIGAIRVGGLTILQAHDTIARATSILAAKSRIEIRLINNTVYLLGEFTKQGSYNMTKNKLTVYEAITLGGGLTDYAKRDKIKVLRTENGVRKLYMIDLLSGNQIAKNMFFIYPNDIIYAEPMKAKAIGLTPTFSLSVLTTVVTFALLIYTFFK